MPSATHAARPSSCFCDSLSAWRRRLGGQLRLDEDFSADAVWTDGLTREVDAALVAFRALGELVETIADRLEQADDTEQRRQLLQEMRGVIRRLESLSDGLNRTLRPAAGGPPTVRWMERSGRRQQDVMLAAVPLDLRRCCASCFDRLKTVVLTSATLAAGGEFDFLESRLGLSRAKRLP